DKVFSTHAHSRSFGQFWFSDAGFFNNAAFFGIAPFLSNAGCFSDVGFAGRVLTSDGTASSSAAGVGVLRGSSARGNQGRQPLDLGWGREQGRLVRCAHAQTRPRTAGSLGGSPCGLGCLDERGWLT